MAFPETKLGTVIEIQPGGVWTDITAKCKTSDPIVHTRGIRNKGSRAEPATVPLKIDNKDGAFSPRNPLSPHDLKLNTPVRLWLPGGTHFLDLDGTETSYATTPDHAALDITGDVDLRWDGEANWYGPGATMLIGKWGASGERSYHMRLQDGLLYMQVHINATAFVFAGATLPALPGRAALRTVLDADNGAGSWTISHFWAESIAGPWTPVGDPFVGTSSPVTVHLSSAPLTISPSHLTAVPPRRPLDGKVYKAQVWGAGVLVADPDFTAQPLGTAGFTDSAGRVWSYAGSAAVADRQDIFVGEISNWPQRWVPSEEAVWTPVTASGTLRRLGQGAKPLDSTLRRRIPSGNPIAYWPMEEDNLASRAYSPIADVAPASVTGVEWAAVDTLPSSKPLPRLTASATLSAIVPDAADGEWQVECVYNADDKAPPASGGWAELLSVSTTGTVRRWVIGMREDQARIYGFDASGTDIIFQTVTFTVSAPFHGWYRLRLYVQDVGGGQMEWVVGWANVDGITGQFSETTTGVPGHVTAVTATWGPLTEGWSIGHLSVLPVAANTIYDGSDSAYSGETAWERLRRLAGEQGVPMARIPGALTPERVGPQRPIRLLELFQAAADADGGMLVEDRTRRGLVYRDRSSMYTQEPALTLVYKQPPLAPPLEPDDDADVTRNDRTVKRDGGSEARAVLLEGRLSVQDPPDGIGLYDDSVTLSLASDTQTEPIAYWLLHLGTYDGARYPSVTIRLHRAPEVIPAVLAMREGDLIRLQNLPGFVAYGDVDLIVTGWQETLLPHTWERTFTCEPGGPWNTAVADHPVYGKANTDGSELAAAVTDTATLLPVKVTAGPPWTTDTAELPVDIEVGGEVMTVNSVPAVASDTFTRTLSNTWGTSSGGAAWATEAGGSASDRSVNGTKGVITLQSSVDTVRRQIIATGVTDAEALVSISPGQTSTGSSLVPGILFRHTDSSNFYRARLHFRTDGAVYLVVTRGSTEQGAQVVTGLTYAPNEVFWLRSRVVGDTVFGRAWKDGTTEPATWQIERTITTSPIASGGVGLSGSALTGFTNTNATISYNDFALYTPRFVAGITSGVRDIFDRTVTSGWGQADIGGTWTTSGGTGTDYAVGSGIGTHTLTSVNVSRRTLLAAPSVDFDLYCDIATSALATGASLTGGIVARYLDTDNLYMARVEFTTSAGIVLGIRERAAGTETSLGSVTTALTHVAGTFYRVRFQGSGTALKAKAWLVGAAEPSVWHVEVADATLTAAGSIGCRSISFASNTNTNPIIRYDNFEAVGPQAFAVTRSVNGVVKAHPVGGPVRLAHPAIAPL